MCNNWYTNGFVYLFYPDKWWDVGDSESRSLDCVNREVANARPYRVSPNKHKSFVNPSFLHLVSIGSGLLSAEWVLQVVMIMYRKLKKQ
jgi:hypothetical protein